MSTETKKASLQLSFVVVGGGLAGFGVAYTLCKAGHKVTVLEKQASLGVPAGGLRVPPNMSKILKSWAGDAELKKTAVLNLGTPWYNLETGERMGYAHWKQTVMTETGGDFLMMKHADVHSLLHRLATAAGAKIRFGVTVTEVSPGSPNPFVTLSTGEVLEADIVIGADGPTSIVRKTILDPDSEDDPQPAGYTIFGAIVPASEMKKYPDTKGWAENTEWPIFMGTNRSLCAHPVHGMEEFALQLYWPDDDAGAQPDDEGAWYQRVPVDSIKYESCCPGSDIKIHDSLKRVLRMAPYLVKTRWMKRSEPLEYWSDETGRIVLIGEAAHPWFPGGTHGPAMALEDAVVFGSLFARLNRWEQVPDFVNAFQEIREGRTVLVNGIDVSNAALMRLSPGPERDARDASIRQSREEWDDGALQKEFEGVVAIFGYEAQDAAEEWWINFGRFKEEKHNTLDYAIASVVVNDAREVAVKS